jgi:hypothetical protein
MVYNGFMLPDQPLKLSISARDLGRPTIPAERDAEIAAPSRHDAEPGAATALALSNTFALGALWRSLIRGGQ